MFSLVTGASGFVGSHLVRHLLSQGVAVQALVRTPERAAELREIGVPTAVGDICDRVTLSRVVRGADIIYHCAAASSLSQDDEIRRTNLDGVRNLLHTAQAEGTSRVILMSSINVLGSGSYENATESAPVQRSREVHADVKIDSEHLALQFAQSHGTNATILRPGLIYGQGERHIPKLAAAVQQGKFVYIGSRNNVVPLIYVHDMVRMMVTASRAQAACGQIYHATDGSRTTIGELVDTIADVTGSAQPKRVLPYFLPSLACSLFELAGRQGPISRTALRFLGTSRDVSIERARRELGFQPYVSLRQGMQQTLNGTGQREKKHTNERAA